MPADYKPLPADLHWYASCVGSLMYAMLGTWPDIAFAVSTLSWYMAKLGPEHITAAKRVLQYFKGSINLELAFRGDLRSLIRYTDANWAGDIDTQRSTSDYLFVRAIIQQCNRTTVQWYNIRHTTYDVRQVQCMTYNV